ncbi:MAG: AAA family ATPase [Bacilli bacterium]|nr:AAA family ATPase [Bacilli bacterium]
MMYIKEIKMQGFKSFADKISIELDQSFTGIVGPNGSGKSNIVDAIKWVLGEQSIKSLRGSNNMTDVIFTGSASRNPANFASVSIIFDNSDRTLNIDFNEVAIKRTVYNTGENEYYINNEKCRLKDITNLFMDSRSSKESFNIIPQNKIDQILSEKPEERRIIFEDAAGVLKYKKRKEESLSKLNHTHENIDRINLIIKENFENLLPLEEASKKAYEYKEALTELESVEIALIAKDITEYSSLLENKKDKKERLEEEIIKIDSEGTSDNTEVEKLKVSIMTIDDKIKSTSDEIFKLNETLIELSNKKTLLTERNKYDKTSDTVKNNIVNLKNREGELKNSISLIELDIKNLNEQISSVNKKLSSSNNEYNSINSEKYKVEFTLNAKKKKLLDSKNEIEVLENNINSMNKVPYSVRSILESPTLRGIHNILGSLVNTEKEYATMLDVALGASSNNIVVDDEACAKEAIEYLKSHNKGRATFFPLNVIKPKSIEPEILRDISNIVGYVGIASSLVTYDSKYYNIVMNQLGNIIVADNINTAIAISKKINHRYRVISLDGEIIHVGGVMTGGSFKTNSSYISDKYELEKLKLSIDSIVEEIKSLEDKINTYDNDLNIIKDAIYKLNIDNIKNNELLNSKNRELEGLNSELSMVNNEIDNLSDKSLDNELNNVIEDYYKHEQKKLELEHNLEVFNKEKIELSSNLSTLEASIKKMNSEYNRINNEINSLEIDITKLNMSLDNLLNRLSEDYNLGYERAKNEYTLEIDEDIARSKVTSLRRKIKSLGEVNLGSIEEYERVSKRVNFLNKQKNDLEKSEEDLLNIINDMDEVMKERFENTFNDINNEFGKVFKTLFKGGSAHLELTDPNNILETGINIIAIPPGKNEKPLSLLSGGERTMTAISLLFSIMNLEKVPFVILDEVESALDENNATIFGQYLENYKNKTQLLVITHKKKTMEFLDKLYGITMQESGVSKVVSVKLDN